MLIELSTPKYPHFDILNVQICPLVQKLPPWPRRVLRTKFLGKKRKNTSFYVMKLGQEAGNMLIGLSTPKYPYFDILNVQIRPLVQKLPPWPRRVLRTKFLGKKRKNTSFYVMKLGQEAGNMLIGLSTPKYPHFDILNVKIRPLVQKLAPWLRKVF